MTNTPVEKRTDQRVELPSHTDVRVTIQGASCELCNISDYGLGIQIDTPTAFHLGQRIEDIRLSLGDRQQCLRGFVAHITRTIKGHVLCIRLEINSIEAYQFIADVKKRWPD